MVDLLFSYLVADWKNCLTIKVNPCSSPVVNVWYFPCSTHQNLIKLAHTDRLMGPHPNCDQGRGNIGRFTCSNL